LDHASTLDMQREWRCQQQLTRLFYYLDQRRYNDLVNLFEPDGVWLRQGRLLTGHADIMQAMQARPETYFIRHVLSNFLVTGSSVNATDAVAYLTAYADDSGQTPSPPVLINAPLSVFVVSAQFSGSGDAPRIARLDLHPEFIFPKAA
jgi:hypothetical protein